MKAKKRFVLRSREMHDETEIPQQLFDKDTLRVIKTRYEFAANQIASRRVLEIGAGPGIGAKYFRDVASEYIATEYSIENIKLFSKNNKGIEVVKADASDLPFPDGRFDSIVALAMIYYLDVPLFFKECARVIRNRGELIFCSTNKNVPGFVPAPFTVKYYSVKELTKLLEMSGFEVSVYGAFRRPYNSLIASYLRYILKTILKACWSVFPSGRASWKNLRTASLGERKRLPDDVRSISEGVEIFRPLNKDKVDRYFRVVYFVAKLR